MSNTDWCSTTEDKTPRGFNINIKSADAEFFRHMGIQLLVSLKSCGWKPSSPRMGKFVYLILKSFGVPDEAFKSGPYADNMAIHIQNEFDAHIIEEFGAEFLKTYKEQFDEEYQDWYDVAFRAVLDDIADTAEEMAEEIKELVGLSSDDGPAI